MGGRWTDFRIEQAVGNILRAGVVVAALVVGAGADAARHIDIAMMVWLRKGPGGRNVLRFD